MDPRTPLHPLMAIAAVSVTVLSLFGIASLTGVLPHANSTPPATVASTAAPEALPPTGAGNPASAATPVPGTAATTAPATPVAATTASPEPQTSAPSPVHHATSHHHNSSHTVARNDSSYADTGSDTAAPSAPSCWNCGTVVAVNAVAAPAKPSGIGAVAGAVIGGVLGHQFGGGEGRKVATAAGAVGGAFAGNEVEKQRSAATEYTVSVRLEDGSHRQFHYSSTPPFSTGDRVRVEDDHLVAY